MKAIIQIHKEGKYYVAEDLITHVAEGQTEEEALKNLKEGLERHYQAIAELAVASKEKMYLIDMKGMKNIVYVAA